MVINIQPSSIANHYRNIFHHQVLRGLEEVLANICKIDGTIPVESREEAWHILSYAFRMPEVWPKTRVLLLTLAPRMEQEGHRDKWIPYLEAGIVLSQSLHDPITEAELSLYMGSLYMLRGKFTSAQEWFVRSLAGFESSSQIRGQGIIFNRLALVARRQGIHKEAKQFVDDALGFLPEDDPERANSFTVLGEIMLDERNWKKAEAYFRQSIELWQRQPDRRRMAWGLRNLGEALRWQERYDEAIASYEQAIELLTRLQDPVNLATVRVNLGIIYSKMGQGKKALSLYGQAETTFRKTQDDGYLATLYTNMAIAYRRLKQWDAAEQACLSSITIKQKLGNMRSLLNTMDELGLAYHGKKQYAKAIETFQDAIAQLPQVETGQRRQYLHDMLQTHLYESKKANRGSSSLERRSSAEKPTHSM